MSFSSPWARAWDGHELVDLAVGHLAHWSRPRSLVAQHQRVGNRSSRPTSARCSPRPAWLTCWPGLREIRWCFGPPNGWRLSDERRAEGDERVRWTRMLRRLARLEILAKSAVARCSLALSAI